MIDLFESFSRFFKVVPATTDALRVEVYRLRYQVYCVETRFENPQDYPGKMERDSFDDRSVHVLLWHEGTRSWAGTVRLVLANDADPAASFPVEEACGSIFSPRHLGATPFPRETAAEVSRFAVSKEFRRRHAEYLSPDGVGVDSGYDRRLPAMRASGGESRADIVGNRHEAVARTQEGERRAKDEERQIVPYITLGLIGGLVGLSARHGVTHWCAAMEYTLLRRLTRLGI